MKVAGPLLMTKKFLNPLPARGLVFSMAADERRSPNRLLENLPNRLVTRLLKSSKRMMTVDIKIPIFHPPIHPPADLELTLTARKKQLNLRKTPATLRKLP
jgi:hypothetical protein